MGRYRVLLCEAHWTRDCCSRRSALLSYRSDADRNTIQRDFVMTNWSYFRAVFTCLFPSALSEQWAGKDVEGGDSYLIGVAFQALVSRGWRNRKKNHVLLNWDSNPSSCRFDGNESIIRRYKPEFSTVWFSTNHMWRLALMWFGYDPAFLYTKALRWE